MKRIPLIFFGLCLVKIGLTQSSYNRFVDSLEKKIRLNENTYSTEDLKQIKNSDSTTDWESIKFIYSDDKGSNLIYADSWSFNPTPPDSTITEYYFNKRRLIKVNVYFSNNDSVFKLSLYFKDDKLVNEDLYLNDDVPLKIQSNQKVKTVDYYIKRSKEFLRFRPKILDSHRQI